MNPYDKLGVDKDAGPEEIKKAYRSKASKAHPDREGGSHEEFVAVKKAYEVLSDPEKRSRYDQTGDSEDPQGENPYEFIMQVFAQVVECCDEVHTDILSEVKKHFMAQRTKTKKDSRGLRKSIRKWRNVFKRIKAKDKEHNPIRRMAEEQRKALVQQYLGVRRARGIIDKCLKLIDGMSYEFDPWPSPPDNFERWGVNSKQEQLPRRFGL